MNIRFLSGLPNYLRRLLGAASFPRRSQVLPVVSQTSVPVRRQAVPPDLPTL